MDASQDSRSYQFYERLIGKTGAEVFHEMMLKNKVQCIFGYPGGAILPVFDAIHESPYFTFVLARHEQGACHMAEGYARASGRPGVVLVTSGPGATNTLTAVADAFADGVPLVIFTGQVSTSVLGTGAFQEVDIISMSKAVTKTNVMVKNVLHLPRLIDEAFDVATTGRPGPVLVDLPKDVTSSVLNVAFSEYEACEKLYDPQSGPLFTREKQYRPPFERALELISESRRPVIYAGHGVIQSSSGPRLLRELAEKASIPVTTSLHGLGAFDELDKKSLRMLGMHGTAYANMAVQRSDMIIALGGRFDDRVTMNTAKFAVQARNASQGNSVGIIHFDIVPGNINKVIKGTLPIEGDLGMNLEALIPLVRHVSMSQRREWFEEIDEWKRRWPMEDYGRDYRPGMIKAQTVIEELDNLTANRKDSTYITTGVGQHQMWTAQYFRWRFPRTFITSGGLGTMGFGLPAAIGVKVALPEALVIDIDGDASFTMTAVELSTASQNDIDVKIIIINNEEQGMVTQLQNSAYEDRYSQSHQRNPDFMKLADSMRVQHKKVTHPDEVLSGLQWLLGSRGIALLEVVTDKKVLVLPAVNHGDGLSEMTLWDIAQDKKRRLLMNERTNGAHGK